MTYPSEILVFGGMDLDTNPNLIKQGDYGYAENITISISNRGVKEKQKSTKSISYELPEGENKVMISRRDNKTGNTIYLIWNSQNKHSILLFDATAETISPILEPIPSREFTTEFLEFDINDPVTHADIIDNNLLWLSSNTDPKHLEIDRAIAFMKGLSPGPGVFPYPDTFITESTSEKTKMIWAIKRPPTSPPTATYSTDTTQKYNHIKEKLFQFRYRFVYSDRSKSTFSPISTVPKPNTIEEMASGMNLLYYGSNNKINVVVNTGNSNVVAIEIAVREGNTGTWEQIDVRIKKYNSSNQRLLNDNESYIFGFYGSENRVPLSAAETALNFHTIPKKAAAQKTLYNNHLLYACTTDGFDQTALDVSMGYTFTEETFKRSSMRMFIDPDLDAYTVWWFSIYNDGSIASGPQKLSLPDSIDDLQEGSEIHVIIQVDTVTSYDSANLINMHIVYEVTAADVLSLTTLRVNLIAAINNSPLRYNKAGLETYVASDIGFVLSAKLFNAVDISGDNSYYAKFYDVMVVNPIEKIQTWKKGCTHKFAIEYQDDAGRTSTANISDASLIYVPTLPEEVPAADLFRKNYSVQLSMTINHYAPEWATKYQILWGGRSIGRSVHMVLNGNPTPELNGGILSVKTVSVPVVTTMNYFNNSTTKGVGYEYQEGDRLRVVTRSNITAETEVIDVQVFSYDSATQTLICEPFEVTNVLGRVGILVEVYNKSQDQNTIYYEIGESFSISGRMHSGNTQTQTFTQPAIIELSRGDCFLINRAYDIFQNISTKSPYDYAVSSGTVSANPFDVVVESDNYSDFYVSTVKDIGRLNLFSPYAKEQKQINRITNGGQYRTGELVNSIFNFDPTNETFVDIAFGEITALQEVGFVLKVLQQRKQSSIYIQRRLMTQDDSTQAIVLSDDFYAEFRPASEPYGCRNPESVIVHNRSLYYYDSENIAIVRDSANGQTELSEAGFKSFVTAFSKSNLGQTTKVYMAVDDNKNLLYMVFNGTNGGVMTFDLVQNAPISFHPNMENVDFISASMSGVIAFKNGGLHVIEAGEGYLQILGSQATAVLEIVENKANLGVKKYANISVYSNEIWDSPVIGDIYVEPGINYPQGMSSRLKASKYRAKNNILYASFLRDAKTPNFATEDEAIMRGRTLEGTCMRVKLKNSSNSHTEIRGAVIHVTPVINKP